MQNRNIVTCIILSIVTCGIYSIVWLYQIATGFDQAQTQEKVSTSPGVTILLSWVTCGIYGVYCYYKWGRQTSEICAYYGRQEQDRGILYLILSIFGLGIVNMVMIQNDFNTWTTPPTQ
jgi:hypothetical protein